MKDPALIPIDESGFVTERGGESVAKIKHNFFYFSKCKNKFGHNVLTWNPNKVNHQHVSIICKTLFLQYKIVIC